MTWKLLTPQVSRTEKLLFSSSASVAGFVRGDSGTAGAGGVFQPVARNLEPETRHALQQQVEQTIEDEGAVKVVSRGDAAGSTMALANPVPEQVLQAAVAASFSGMDVMKSGGGGLHLLPAAALELPGSFLEDHVFIDITTMAATVRASCMLGDASFPQFDCLAQIYQGNVDPSPPGQPLRAYVTPVGTPKAIAFGSCFDKITSNWTVWHDLSDSTRSDQTVQFAVSKQLVFAGGAPMPRPGRLGGQRFGLMILCSLQTRLSGFILMSLCIMFMTSLELVFMLYRRAVLSNRRGNPRAFSVSLRLQRLEFGGLLSC